jgi:PAS domain S-box-containing protein
MRLPGRDKRHPQRRLSLTGIAAVIVIVVATAAGAGIWDRRREALAEADRELSGLALVLADETARGLEAADAWLRVIAANIRSVDSGDTSWFAAWLASDGMRDFLQRRLRDLPQGKFAALTAADGRVVNAAGGVPGAAAELLPRVGFDYLRNRGADRSDLGAVTASGIRSLFFARRLGDAGGRFLGVVTIAVDVDPLERFYRSIIAPMGGTLTLLRADGTILARWPERPPLAAGGSTVVARQPVGGFDLAIAIAVPQASVLADWRRHSAGVLVAALSAAAIFILLFRALALRSRSLEFSQAELRESEARLGDFALTSSDWFWETDAEHRFVYQSEQIRDFGQDPAKRRGRLRVDLAADVEREPVKWREHMQVLDRHEPFRDFVYERQVGDDPPHIISVSGNPVFDAAGRFLGYRGTARNITEEALAERSLRAAKAAAEAANLAKSHFLANISHELRTPLNAILGFAELLERGAGGPLAANGVEYAGLIRQSGAHLLAIINDLLDLARIDAGRLELADEHGIDPCRLVGRCLELAKPQADAAGLRLSAAVEGPAPLLVADRTRLTEILLNLLSNAIKFSEPGGEVVVMLRQTPEGEVVFEVRDTGIGMSGPEIEIALEPFGQVDPGFSRRVAGAGLGLPLARRLAELHGGAIEIRSEKGVGTTAILVLPPTRAINNAVFAEAGVEPS